MVSVRVTSLMMFGFCDDMLSVKKGGAGKKTTKKDKDPNMPKRPPSAFFVFMYEYRRI